jgi:hypothetical protein
MAGRSPFTWAHVSSLAARAGDLERIGEETQNPRALIRAARLFREIAARIAQRLAAEDTRLRHRGEFEPRA